MKRRRLILTGALAAVLAGIVLAWPRGPKEPVYQGKKLSRWMREAYEDGIRGTSKYRRAQIDAAREAIKAIGTNAVPFLLSEFDNPVSSRAMQFNRWAIRNNLRGLRMATGQDRRSLATLSLYLLGPKAAPAVPALVPRLTDTEQGKSAAQAMSQCTAIAVPHVLDYYSGTNGHLLEFALGRLVMSVGAYEEELRPIVELLKHTNALVRGAAAGSLRFARPQPLTVVPVLSKALSDPDSGVQDRAAASLQSLGTNAITSVSTLRRLLERSDPEVVAWASNALFRIDPAALPPRGP